MIRGVATLLIWFVGRATVPTAEPTTVLGVANFVGPPLSSLFFLVALACAKDVRAKYGITLPFISAVARTTDQPEGSADPAHGQAVATLDSYEESYASTSGSSSTLDMEFFTTSLKAMVVDLCQQASISAGVYVASFKGLAVSYQVAAMQSALPAYGTAWALGFSLAAKSVGPQLIASGVKRAFPGFAAIVVAYGLAVGLLSGVAGVVPFHSYLAANYGESACGYASSEGCAPVYASIFGGETGLPSTFERAFSVAAALNTIYLLVKPLLYACMDIDFMMYTSLASIVFAFLPAILASEYASGAPAYAIFLSMYAPHMLLIPVFLARLYANCRRILRGESGPWSEFARHHERAESYRASVSLVSIKETLVCSGALVSDSSALVHVEIPAESNAGQI